VTATVICVDGLIEHYTEDGPEYWACHGCAGCAEVAS
jgi:Pyruvate/2-oxoacid:ferredoxin oxidoreductase delta subunit